MIAAERETVAAVTKADDVVRIWSAIRTHITATRRSPSFTEISCGRVDGTEWAEFDVPADTWNPVRGVKPSRKQSSEQKRAASDRLAAARAAKTEGATSVKTSVVKFDRELGQLHPDEAEAWRAWLVQHQLDHLSIACPSKLIYHAPTKRRPATVTVELLTRDNAGSFRVKKTVTFSGPLVPFPRGFKVEESSSHDRRRGNRLTPASVDGRVD
jgi:hypothetical protein